MGDFCPLPSTPRVHLVVTRDIFFSCGKTYIMQNLYLEAFFSVQFRVIEYIHIIVQPSPYPSQELFHLTELKLCTHLTVTSHTSLCSDLGNHYSLFCLYEFDCSRYLIPVESYKLVCFDTCPLSRPTMHSSPNHVAWIGISFFFVRLNYIPLYVHTTIGHVDCFHLSALVDNVAVYIGI